MSCPWCSGSRLAAVAGTVVVPVALVVARITVARVSQRLRGPRRGRGRDRDRRDAEDGRREAVVRDDQRVATLAPGDCFGEVGLLSTTWRVATVQAFSPMRLLVVGPPEFQTMMLTLPGVAERIAQAASERK